MDVDPERNFTVACGSTEAMIATMLAVVDPGEEVIVFEPFTRTTGRTPSSRGGAPLRPPPRADWTFDEDELRAAVNERTRRSS